MSRRESTDVLRIDPHVHSVESYDCVTPVERILERARTVGLDGVVVTDHDAIEGSLRAAERAPNYGLLGIPGVEISTAEGHLLGIGVEESPPPGRPLVETVEEIRTRGGVAVVPHPFQRSKHGAKKCVIEICDGIEVHNAQAMTGFWNQRARAFALARDYSRIGASDAHSAGTVGRAYTEVRIERESEADREAVLDAIRAGNTVAKGRRATVRQYLGTVAASAGRWTRTLGRHRVRGGT